ncbi:MAG: DUF2953 domain-containing protein [Ruminococcaceae bacterium]|nr:DUF2953 domain-containing protein [Oscillospiraceae bacterium]
MTALIIIACIALFFLLVLSLRVKVTLEYKDELLLFVSVGFIKVRVLPKKQRRGPHSMSRAKAKRIRAKVRKKALEKKQKQLEKKRLKKLEKQKKKQKRSFDDVLDIIAAVKEIVTTALGRFFGHLRVDIAKFHINVATQDAATTAILYGAVCSALSHLFHILEPLRGFDLPKTQDVSVNADYLSEKTTVDIKLSFSLRVWHALHVAIATLIKIVKHMVLFKSKNEALPDGHKNKTA